MENPTDTGKRPFFVHPLYRAASALFGSLLIGLAGWIALDGNSAHLAIQLGAVALFLGLGGNLVWAAWNAREPWVSKIGPLP